MSRFNYRTASQRERRFYILEYERAMKELGRLSCGRCEKTLSDSEPMFGFGDGRVYCQLCWKQVGTP